MDAAVLGLLAILVLVAVVGLAFVKLQGSGEASSRSAGAEDDMDVADVGQNRAARRRGARGRMGAADLRHRHQAQHAAVPLRRVDDGTSSSATGSDESDDEGGQGRRPGKKNKKDRKRADRQARQEAREEAAEARRQEEERRATPSAYEERMRKRDADREAREQAQEEEIRRAAEEKQRLEDEEAAKWMGQISVQEEGTGADEEADNSSGLLGQFVDYIMARKTVPLEQIATDFKLRTTDVIDRIHRLEEMGRLTGVMDDRGKYIYISLPEMECVAKFLTERGRVSIAELATKSSTLIDLEPKAATATTLHMGAGIDFDSVLAT